MTGRLGIYNGVLKILYLLGNKYRFYFIYLEMYFVFVINCLLRIQHFTIARQHISVSNKDI